MSRGSRRLVRFYDPEVVQQDGQPQNLGQSFWPEIFDKLAPLGADDREASYNGVRYYGEVCTCRAPALRYLYVGRVRGRPDFPHTYRRGAGSGGRLELGEDGDELTEPTYVVPFGSRNFVAVLAPVSTAVRAGALGRWLNLTLGFVESEERIELTPLLSPTLERDLRRAVGATSARVKLAPGGQPPAGLGQVARALSIAREVADEEAFVDLRLSFGSRGAGSSSARSGLLNLARNVAGAEDGAISAATVSLQVPNEDGSTRIAEHDLIEDLAVEEVVVHLGDGPETDEARVLTAALGAAEVFEQRRREADESS